MFREIFFRQREGVIGCKLLQVQEYFKFRIGADVRNV